MLTDAEIALRIKSAFLPLRCEIELGGDYGRQVRFRLFDAAERTVMAFPDEQIARLRTVDELNTFLLAARDRIERKGHNLAKWPDSSIS